MSQPLSPSNSVPDDAPMPAVSKPSSWVAAVLPVMLIAACAELGISILNNSALPVYFTKGLHIPTGVMGLILVWFFIAESVFKSPLGVLADRIGRKPLMLGGAAITVFTPILLISTHYDPAAVTAVAVLVTFGFLRALDGLGEAALWPSLYAYVGDVVQEKQRGAAMGLLNVVYMIGIAISFLAGGFADDSFGPWLTKQETFGEAMHRVGHRIHQSGNHLTERLHHHAHAAVAALPAVPAPPVVSPDHQPEYYFPSFYLASVLFAVAVIAAMALRGKVRHEIGPAGEGSGESITSAQFIGALKSVPQFLGIAFVTFLGIGCIAPIMKLFVLAQFHITETEFGVLVLPPALAIAAVAVPAGHLADKWGTTRSVRLGFLLCAVGLLAIPALHSLGGDKIEFITAATVMGVGFVVAFPAWLALLTVLGGEHQRGTVFAAVSTAQGMGALVGVLVGTKLYDSVSHIAPFIAASLFVSLGTLLTLIFVRERVLSRVVLK
jgi:DHA1 family multidrug resistance protein-like MFS transporter